MPKFIILIFLIFEFTLVIACKCKTQKPKESFCNADWVSRVKVSTRTDSQLMPAGISDRQIPSNTKYEVQHIQTIKNSAGGVLPTTIYTPMEDGACGILLETGHEYLLSGSFVNGTVQTSLCKQILLEDLKESRNHDILEWEEVPTDLRKQITDPLYAQSCE